MRRTPTLRAGALVVVDGRLLLVRQRRSAGTYWLLPGGGVRFGESLGEALERELYEELSLRVVAGRPLALVEAISPDMLEYPKHVVHVILEALITGEGADVRLGDDPAVLEARLFTAEELQGVTLAPPVGDFLSACLGSLPAGMVYLGRRW